jgi:peptidoglycan/xylan/chitin deacetylase (PgdA/CDA1 family)
MSVSVPVLCYHSVASSAPAGFREWTIDPALFRQHLEVIASRGARTPTVSEYAATLEADFPVSNTVVLTFDDGFADFATTVAPLLVEFDMRATLYVTTGCLGREPEWLPPEARAPMLSPEAIVGLPDANVEIGAHAQLHPELDVISRSAARAEIEGSKHALEDILGRSVASFAYPFGYHNRAVRQQVVDAGFTSACAVKQALSGPGDDIFALARVLVPGDLSADGLARVLDAATVTRARAGERLRTKAWRAARWSRWQVSNRRGRAVRAA